MHFSITGQDHRDGTYTITLTPQTTDPHQLVIIMDDQHVQNSPHDLDVRSKCDYLTLCNAQAIECRLRHPSCVAVHDNGDLYIVKFCSMCDQTGQLKKIVGRGTERVMVSSQVQGVYTSRKMRCMLLTFVTTVCRSCHHARGELHHTFGQKGSGQGQFDRPSAVIVGSNNRLIVADTTCNNHI